jgi:mannose-6-phosphate isomerase-like protein (cupin superfamily)
MTNYVEERPWGRFEILVDEEYTKVKRITVSPGGKLSLQSHQKRNEHWIVVSGEGQVTLGKIHVFGESDKVVPVTDDGKQVIEKYPISYGNHIFIKRTQLHRVENLREVDLVFIETQTGTYFGEDDIERFDDEYGRE